MKRERIIAWLRRKDAQRAELERAERAELQAFKEQQAAMQQRRDEQDAEWQRRRVARLRAAQRKQEEMDTALREASAAAARRRAGTPATVNHTFAAYASPAPNRGRAAQVNKTREARGARVSA